MEAGGQVSRVSDNICPHCPCLCTPSHHFCLAYTLESCLGLLCFLFLTGGKMEMKLMKKLNYSMGVAGLVTKWVLWGLVPTQWAKKLEIRVFVHWQQVAECRVPVLFKGERGVEYKEYNQSTHFDCSQTNESVCRCVVMRVFLRNKLRCAATTVRIRPESFRCFSCLRLW